MYTPALLAGKAELRGKGLTELRASEKGNSQQVLYSFISIFRIDRIGRERRAKERKLEWERRNDEAGEELLGD